MLDKNNIFFVWAGMFYMPIAPPHKNKPPPPQRGAFCFVFCGSVGVFGLLWGGVWGGLVSYFLVGWGLVLF